MLLLTLRRAAGVLILIVGVVSVVGAGEPDEAVREQLRNRIEAAGLPVRLTVDEEPIHAAVAVRDVDVNRVAVKVTAVHRLRLARRNQLLLPLHVAAPFRDVERNAADLPGARQHLD